MIANHLNVFGLFVLNRVKFGESTLLPQGDTASPRADLGLGLNVEFSAFFLMDCFVCMTLSEKT